LLRTWFKLIKKAVKFVAGIGDRNGQRRIISLFALFPALPWNELQ